MQEEILSRANRINQFILKNRSEYKLGLTSLQMVQKLAIISKVVEELEQIKRDEEIVFLDDLHELIKRYVIEEPVPICI